MAPLRQWIERAREAALTHVPEPMLQRGRLLRDRVLAHVPPDVKTSVQAWLAGEADHVSATGSNTPTPMTPTVGDDGARVVAFTHPEDESTMRLREIFRSEGAVMRVMDLHQDPKTARQLAGDTGQMVPPYVYIDGRFWGDEGEITSLHVDGDLTKILARDLDRLSESALRLGRIRKSFDDAITVENVVSRLKQGHILSVGDLDCWYEVDRDGNPRLFYEGTPRAAEQVEHVARDIVRRVDAREVEVRWMLEPVIHVG